jgi:hypothetical protein
VENASNSEGYSVSGIMIKKRRVSSRQTIAFGYKRRPIYIVYEKASSTSLFTLYTKAVYKPAFSTKPLRQNWCITSRKPAG